MLLYYIIIFVYAIIILCSYIFYIPHIPIYCIFCTKKNCLLTS